MFGRKAAKIRELRSGLRWWENTARALAKKCDELNAEVGRLKHNENSLIKTMPRGGRG